MIEQHITLYFDKLQLKGDNSSAMQKELLTEGFTFSRSLLDDFEIDDPDQLRVLESFDNEDDVNDVWDLFEDEFQFMGEYRDEYAKCELVDYEINWQRSTIS